MDSKKKNEGLEAVLNLAEKYAQRTNTYFCSDRSVTAYVLEGLAQHKEELGSPLCPCRYYFDKQIEANSTFWNCPCLPMRERKECHCMLFLTPDNEFSSNSQNFSLSELIQEINNSSN